MSITIETSAGPTTDSQARRERVAGILQGYGAAIVLVSMVTLIALPSVRAGDIPRRE